MRSSRIVVTILLAVTLAACTPSAPQASIGPFIRDDQGTKRLQTAQIGPHTVVDSLSGEELALASPVLAQVELEREFSGGIWTTRRATPLLGGPVPARVWIGGDVHGLVAVGRAPLLSLTPVNSVGAAIDAVSSVGYFDGTAVNYRTSSGTIQRYPVRDTNLFGCLAQHGGAACEERRLRAYGVDTAARLRAFRNLRRNERLAAALWFVIFNDHHQHFPDRVCASDVSKMNCASYRRFQLLSKFMPSS